MSDHALFSASGSQRWMNCPGSLALEDGMPNLSSEHADLGTVFHEIMSSSLRALSPAVPFDWMGEKVRVINGKIEDPFEDYSKIDIRTDHTITVGKDMVDYAEASVRLVDDFTPPGAIRLIEKRVDFSRHIGVPDSFGTCDVGIVHKDEICGIDHKYGVGVPVYAEDNSQQMLYALGLLDMFNLTHDIKRVRLVINQPRIGNISEWTCSVEHLLAFATRARNAAKRSQDAMKHKELHGEDDDFKKWYVVPSEKSCKFCRAKSICPALRDHALNLIADDFVDLDNEPVALAKLAFAPQIIPSGDLQRLSTLMKGVPLVELWLKSVREAVFQHLANGNPVPSFKLVRGKQGNRKWKDDAEAEKAFKAARIHSDDMYDKYIISPTAAEKLLKDRPRLWNKINEHVTRAEGKLSVAPESDKREAVAVADISGDFMDLEGDE